MAIRRSALFQIDFLESNRQKNAHGGSIPGFCSIQQQSICLTTKIATQKEENLGRKIFGITK